MLIHSFVYVLSVAAFPLQWWSGIVATESVWPEKCEIFPTWPFIEKVCVRPRRRPLPTYATLKGNRGIPPFP